MPKKTRFPAALWLAALAATLSSPPSPCRAELRFSHPHERYLAQMDELSALWSFYKYAFVSDGRVVALDEGRITTSEGQGYAMLRAAWMNDRVAFRQLWGWTHRHLQIRGEDRLFAWKWRDGRVLDRNSATDADTDIALALLIASDRFAEPFYRREAAGILGDIWSKEIIRAGNEYYVTAGNWAPRETNPTLHVAYFAPYAYFLFSRADPIHPWKKLIDSSYEVLNWLYFDQNLELPPEVIYLDKARGRFLLENPRDGRRPVFSYDAFPIFWRVSVDNAWWGRSQGKLRRRMLEFFEREWKNRAIFYDRFSLDGTALSRTEGLPLYATVHALALVEDRALAKQIRSAKLDPLWVRGLDGRSLPYYLQNWMWLDRAFELQAARTYQEFLGFLRPFDFDSFSARFPWLAFFLLVGSWGMTKLSPRFKLPLLAAGFYLCVRYLYWRLLNSLNFLEGAGPVISLLLWAAEFYSFSTVVLLLVQVGLRRREPARAPRVPKGFAPSVDVFIPIYSESREILEKTLIAASSMRYANKRIYVCDDSHRDSVRKLAENLGAAYVRGPKRHAKAGNLNNALKQSSGELIAVFDTDHIPVTSFLAETVPFFSDPKMGFVQTPHHFYNEDIFQRAFLAGKRVPDEQDMFNHAIQGARNGWGGSFFVGSGAVFRRAAMEQVGGFNLMSITEDIHTSQHLHAAGWKSAFVDRDLAVGLAAENLSSYIVQRRRWMLGCLQIFFKDNPLFCRGLPWRHRVGYFASQYYFFFPAARVIFWVTPLYFLLFHWHPIFSDVSVLLAYLLPSMVALPLISDALVPGWPRMLWGTVYESAVSFALFRSTFDLLLPRNLGFKVTPKGLTSQRRTFDFQSSKAALIASGITLLAISKGITEFFVFGIEKDAYFLNIAWAGMNFSFLLTALLVAWEKPQRRAEERIRKSLPFKLRGANASLDGSTEDISLGGFSFRSREKRAFSELTVGELSLPQPIAVTVRHVRSRGRRHAFRFVDLFPEARRALLLATFASAGTWERAHDRRCRTQLGMAASLIRGILRGVGLRDLFRPGPASLTSSLSSDLSSEEVLFEENESVYHSNGLADPVGAGISPGLVHDHDGELVHESRPRQYGDRQLQGGD